MSLLSKIKLALTPVKSVPPHGVFHGEYDFGIDDMMGAERHKAHKHHKHAKKHAHSEVGYDGLEEQGPDEYSAGGQGTNPGIDMGDQMKPFGKTGTHFGIEFGVEKLIDMSLDMQPFGRTGTHFGHDDVAEGIGIAPFANVPQPGGSAGFGYDGLNEPTGIAHPMPHSGLGTSFGYDNLDEAPYEDYGEGATGVDFAGVFGSRDPFTNSAFGDEQDDMHEERMTDDLGELDAMTPFSESEATDAFRSMDQDPYDSPQQIPTVRNPVTHFGFDDSFYSGSGPAAVIGCEDEYGAGTGALKK